MSVASVKRLYFTAGVYGLIVIFPVLFMETKIGRDEPPPITHPEFFYGFLLVGLAFQLVFLVIAKDPERYRSLMPLATLEKIPYAGATLILYFQHRITGCVFGLGMVDLAWGLLFGFAYLRMTPVPPRK